MLCDELVRQDLFKADGDQPSTPCVVKHTLSPVRALPLACWSGVWPGYARVLRPGLLSVPVARARIFLSFDLKSPFVTS